MNSRLNNHPDVNGDGARSAIAFLAEMTAELSGIARSHRFEVLAYLLDMARLEAENLCRNAGISNGPS